MPGNLTITIDPSRSPLDAVRLAASRGLLPSALSSKEQQEALSEAMRELSVFSARTTNAHYLQTVRDVINQVLSGDMDLPLARLTLRRTLDSLGYTPEGGFPEDEVGLIPPAVEGTLTALDSDERLNLMLDTQVALQRGRGQRDRGNTAAAVRAFPAWELVRVGSRDKRRNWESRWRRAGGKFYDGRMIALKNDPFWGELGSSSNYDDALDVATPPFAFNSGMGWRGVSRDEAVKLGVVVTDGDETFTVDDAMPPKIKASSEGLDEDFVKRLQAELKAEKAKDGTLTISDIVRKNLERNEG